MSAPGRLVAAALLAVAFLIGSVIVAAMLAKLLYPVVEEARRVLGNLGSLGGSSGNLPLPIQPGSVDATTFNGVVHGVPARQDAGHAELHVKDGYAVLTLVAAKAGDCRIYVNATLVRHTRVEPGQRLTLYIASVDGRPIAAESPPRHPRLTHAVIAVDCGGVTRIWEVGGRSR